MSNSLPSDKLLSKKQEKRLLKAGEKVFRTHFPNPERIGCPGSESLKAMAFRELSSIPEEFFDHLTCCSPCFVEYSQFLNQARYRGRLKALAFAAGLVIFIGAILWLYPDLASFLKKEPTGEEERLALLDLRGKSRLRSEEPVETVEPQLTLSREASALQIYLPIGSEEGRYEMQLLRSPSEQPLVHAEGTAELRDQNVILEVDFNLGEVDAGKYLLGIRKPGFSWAHYAVNVKD